MMLWLLMDYMQHSPTVTALIEEINRAYDDYISLKITDTELKSIVRKWAHNSVDKLFAGSEQFNPTVLQRVGKKRVKLIIQMVSDFQSELKL